MKKFVAMALTGIMAASLMVCSVSAEEKTSLNIGLAFPMLDEGMTNLSNGIIACLENNYPDYEIEYTLTNADTDINKLISDVESLIAMNPDMIYIMNSIGDQGVIPAVNACIEAGVPVGVGVSIDGYDGYTFLYEGFSQYACGQMQAEYMESIYDKDAEYNCAVITGDAGNSAGQARSDGFIENFIDVHDNANLVIMGEGNWATDDSQALVDDWLIAYPEINLICCASDDEAQGAVNACKAADREDVIIISIDATDLGKEAIKKGEIDCSVAINFLGVASMCADALVDCAIGEITGTGNQVVYTTENLEIVTADTLE
jgi:ribose transport system substrate-binding protein